MNVNSLIDLHNPLFLSPIRLLDLSVRFTRRPFFIKYPTNMALSHAGRLWIFGILVGHTLLCVANGAPVLVSILLTLISATSKHLQRFNFGFEHYSILVYVYIAFCRFHQVGLQQYKRFHMNRVTLKCMSNQCHG